MNLNIMPNKFIALAVKISRNQMRKNAGGPFGAVIVKEGKIIARGWNMVTSANDPTAHAEIVAIRKACKRLSSFNLKGCVLYTSCEPCPMCFAAINWARLDRVYYANTRHDAAKIGFDDKNIYRQFGLPDVKMEQIKITDAKAVFDEWALKKDKIPY
jgi:guanine deaminase